MIEELLKIIHAADKLLLQHQSIFQNESIQLITACYEELEEIDDQIHEHFKKDIER